MAQNVRVAVRHLPPSLMAGVLSGDELMHLLNATENDVHLVARGQPEQFRSMAEQAAVDFIEARRGELSARVQEVNGSGFDWKESERWRKFAEKTPHAFNQHLKEKKAV